MKTLASSFALLFALLLTTHFSPLAAQYNPPPPPEQANTGEPYQQQMGQVPPPDQGGPGQGDDSVPPPDMQDAPDQGGGPDQGDANFQTFYDNLSSQGNWVQTDNYGYVFQPNEEDPDWAPYTDGHWVYTDEGWTWVADDSEPFGWATYHYGRWANLDGYGWVWVPGYTWAPAWVSWRYGDGYCGWAPLPPDTFVGVDVGGVGAGFVFHIGGDCDTAYDIGPRYYNFLPVGYLGSRNYRHHFADRNNNFAIINNTRNVTNIVVNNRRGSGRFSRVSTGGPDIATVDAQSSTRIQRVQLARGNRAGNPTLNGNRLTVFAPRVNSTNAGNFRPRSVAAHVATANINNGANINQPLQVTQRVHGRAANAAQITAAQNVHFSQGSHVATPDLRPTHTFNRPLTSFPTRSVATPNANVQSNSPVNNNGSANGVHPEANFTGQNGNPNHHDHANTHVQQQQNVATPQVQQAQVQQSQQVQQAQQAQQARQAQEFQHRQQIQQQQQQQQVQHQDFHPQAEVQHQPSAPVQHQQVEHQQPQHQDSRPPEHHDAPRPPEHHDAPQQHSNGGNNGGGNHNDNKGNDNKNQGH